MNVMLRCYLTLQQEVGLIPGRAPPPKRDDKRLWTQ